jgi:hypothetical protein
VRSCVEPIQYWRAAYNQTSLSRHGEELCRVCPVLESRL